MLLFIVFGISFDPQDPQFSNDFVLSNKGTYGSSSGEDINIKPVWDEGLNGNSITIGVIGNGCANSNTDLNGRQLSTLHYNLDDGTTNVSPDNDDNQKSRTTSLLGHVVGESNDYCSLGVAYQSSYYCLKTKKTSEDVIRAALKRENTSTHVKYFSVPNECANGKCDPPTSSSLETDIHNCKSIIVAPAGGDSKIGGDTNFYVLTRAPETITVSDTTPSGSRSYWSNRGTSIVVNAPSGGSSYLFGNTINLPSPPSLSVDTTGCSTHDNLNGVGASYVAGLVSLLLSVNSQLTYRDIQSIFALSSTINDPKHESWINNSARYYYSDVYGFGRINSELAVKAARSLTLLSEQKQVSIEIPKIDLSNGRHGEIESSADITAETVKFIEYVEIELNYNELHSLYLSVKSPSGTVLKVILPSEVKETNNNKVKYTIRGFYGETSKGKWTVIAHRAGYGSTTTIDNIKINVYGLSSNPTLPQIERKFGSDSTKDLTKEPEIVLSTNAIKCDTNFTVKINGNKDSYDLFLKKDGKRYQLGSDLIKGVEHTLQIPCFFKNDQYQIYAENRKESVSGSANITYENVNSDDYISSPQPYTSINIENESVSFDMKVVMHMNLGSDSYLHNAFVGLYDLGNNKIVGQKQITLSNQMNVKFDNIKNIISQGILYLIPNEITDKIGCETLVQPVFIKKASDPEQMLFTVPLTGACTLPRDVNYEEFTTPSKTTRIIWIACLSVALALVAVLLVFLYCRQKKKRTENFIQFEPLPN
ncbi:Clan SB, family S8, subtilisin-like serine peptidase [Histomonas meleagridis]|uniref:Clan SB, family S8, subtilisin-like serine peptidase n=1 Tax=Histomonas meleagridis TaxID=135588 RepID=UPI0035594150|nr:Clan SB, family S8, subtilisin-like serine peptidase [Histomonas meleagridis]KAH0801065.1 Clan SB, family S8, subtilisin-like serine peptidase [Histomonas meleagridis]